MNMRLLINRNPALHCILRIPLAIRRRIIEQLNRPAECVLQRLDNLIVGDLNVFIKEFDGKFQLSPRSHLFHRIASKGFYEPELSSCFKSFIEPDRDVIDVGANVGFYTILAGKQMQSGRVLAIEPTPQAFQRLQTNVVQNGVNSKTILVNGAASDEGGRQLDLNTIPDKEEYASLGRLIHPAASKDRYTTVSVTTFTLDELVEKYDLNPAIIKIDVEGAEAQVFSGASKILSQHRPVIISELSNALLRDAGIRGVDIVAKIEEHDYIVTDPFDAKARPGCKEFGDILCIPKEKATINPALLGASSVTSAQDI